MRSNKIFFKKSKTLPVDKFFNNVLYDKKFGYYNLGVPFGERVILLQRLKFQIYFLK